MVPLLSGKGRPKLEAIHFHYPNFAFHKDNRLDKWLNESGAKLPRPR